MKVLKKVDVKSFAKFNLYYMGIVGVIVGLFTGIPMMFLSGNNSGMGLNLTGLAILIGAPVFYAIIGLLSGYFGGVIMNYILKISGGVGFEMEDGTTEAKVIN